MISHWFLCLLFNISAWGTDCTHACDPVSFCLRCHHLAAVLGYWELLIPVWCCSCRAWVHVVRLSVSTKQTKNCNGLHFLQLIHQLFFVSHHQASNTTRTESLKNYNSKGSFWRSIPPQPMLHCFKCIYFGRNSHCNTQKTHGSVRATISRQGDMKRTEKSFGTENAQIQTACTHLQMVSAAAKILVVCTLVDFEMRLLWSTKM